jgi:DNA-binding HxlR family transcriptional regulator
MNKTSQPSTGKEEETCEQQAMHRAISLIGDRWTLFIVYNLLSGPRRFGELLTMGNVSPKTVSQRLKMLEEIGFVERHAFAEIPPRVEYHLTEKGQALVNILDAIRDFGEHYLMDNEAKSIDPLAAPDCH